MRITDCGCGERGTRSIHAGFFGNTCAYNTTFNMLHPDYGKDHPPCEEAGCAYYCDNCWGIMYHIINEKRIVFCAYCSQLVWDDRRTMHYDCEQAQDEIEILAMILEAESDD
jgi:hypothetical protein